VPGLGDALSVPAAEDRNLKNRDDWRKCRDGENSLSSALQHHDEPMQAEAHGLHNRNEFSSRNLAAR
jgi:hypothetical protein